MAGAAADGDWGGHGGTRLGQDERRRAPPMGRAVILTLARGWGAPVRGVGEGGAPFVSPPLRRWYAPRKTKWLTVLREKFSDCVWPLQD